VAIAHDGYDLKGQLWHTRLFQKTHFNGMHSFDDAFVLSNSAETDNNNLAITDLAKIIINELENG